MARVLLVCATSHPVDVDIVESVLSDHEVDVLEVPAADRRQPAAQDALVDALTDHAGILTRTIRVTRRAIDAASELQVVSTHSAGYDHLDLEAMSDHGIVAIHNPDGPAPAVVEHTFAMAFTLLRDLPRRYAEMANGEWFSAREVQPELGQRTVGVLGLGTIGYNVARVAAEGFRAETIAHDPYVSGEQHSPIFPRVDSETVEGHGIELVGRPELFDRADVLLVHVPLTPETRHSIGAAEFDRLDGGTLINVARGPVIDEDALLAALSDGRVARAGLDVFAEEPTDNDELVSHPNVQATPHVAGYADGTMTRTPRLAAQRLLAVLEGRRPDYVLNPEVYDRG
ncbi:MAG: NAD(P)-dependent oxidoreductase [Salinirussus sp.]